MEPMLYDLWFAGDSIDEEKLLHTSVHGYLEMLNSFSVMDIFKACNTDVLSS